MWRWSDARAAWNFRISRARRANKTEDLFLCDSYLIPCKPYPKGLPLSVRATTGTWCCCPCNGIQTHDKDCQNSILKTGKDSMQGWCRSLVLHYHDVRNHRGLFGGHLGLGELSEVQNDFSDTRKTRYGQFSNKQR